MSITQARWKGSAMSSQGGRAAGYCQMARVSIQHSRYDEAIVLIRQAIAREPTSAEAYELLGVALSRKGLLQEAVDALSTAVGLAPTTPGPHFNLALAYQRAGNVQAAMAELNETLRLDPMNQAARQQAEALYAAVSQPQPAAYGAAPQGPYAQAPAGAYAPGPYGAPPGRRYGAPGGYGSQAGYGQPGPYGATPGYGGYYGQAVAQGYPAAGADTGGWSLENVMRLLTAPREFVSEQRGQTGYGAPIGLFLVQMALVYMVGAAVAAIAAGMRGPALQVASGPVIGVALLIALLAAVIVVPLALAGTFIGAGIIHLVVMLFKGQGGYVGTFRAVVYASVAVSIPYLVLALLEAVVPSAGIAWALLRLGFGIWSIVVLVVGLMELHEMGAGGAVAAALLPIVLAFVVLFLAVMALGAALLGMRGSQGYGPPPNRWGTSSPSYGPSGFPAGPSGFPSGPSGRFGRPPGGFDGPAGGFDGPPRTPGGF